MSPGRRHAYKDAAPRTELRECLRCGRPFMSFGPQNRLCLSCNRFAEAGGLGGLPESFLRSMPFDGARRVGS